jgi:glycosyltransferase involved in cell wall biosynthesis
MGEKPLVIAYADEDENIPFSLSRWPAPCPTMAHRLKTVARQLPAHLGLSAARAGFWVERRHRWALDELRRHRPRLVMANDWPALVVAAAYKDEYGGFIHYDTHEFAMLEFDERAFWRVVYKPMVTHLEGSCIGAADTISTVGPKLAEALEAHYRLAQRPAVIRNIPDRIRLDEQAETAWPLRILYHGQVLPDRGLEALISSIPLWRAPHRLTIRGDGDEGYIAGLKAKVAATGRAELVTFEKAVNPDEVMPLAARTADLGVHFSPLGTDQRHFSLPNKLFEYIGAGLAVAVSPGVDLRAVVESHGVGVVSRDAIAEGVAEVINNLTQASVANFKVAARRAAQTLCWASECEVLRAVLVPLIRRL